MINRFLGAAFVIVAMLLCLGSVARADDAASALVKRGLAQFNQGNFNKAIALLERAVSRPEALGAEGVATAQAHVALSYALTGRKREARRAFERAIIAWPAVTIDRKRFSAEVLGLFDQARRRALGTLIVKAEEEGLTIYVDQARVGSAPVKTQVRAGRHVVQARRDGGDEVWNQRVEIAGGTVTTLVVGKTVIKIKPMEKAEPGPRLWTWITGGASLIPLTFAITYFIRSEIKSSEINASKNDTTAERDAKVAELRELERNGNISLGVAGGLAATAVALFFIEGHFLKRAARERASRRVWLSPTIGWPGLVLGGRF